MESQERVRLLIIDGDEPIKGRGGRISHGAATVVSRWPGYIASLIWFLVCAISVITLFMLMMFTLLVREERTLFIRGSGRSCKNHQNHTSFKLNNQFCKEMTNLSTLSGEIKREVPNIKILNAADNIFYVRSKPLSRLSSCAVESMLKNGADKTIYIMMFEKYELNYESALKSAYKNLKLNKVNGKDYLKRTPFNWKHNDDAKTMIAAGLLTIWQFGGTVISDNLVAVKTIKDINKYDKAGEQGTCLIDYEMLSCPEQCAAFIYEFIQELVCYNMSNGAAPIIDKSLVTFCGKNTKDCDGARRATNLCDDPTFDPLCEFVRLDMWIEADPTWENIVKHCPVTDRHFKSIKTTTIIKKHKTTKVGTTARTKATSPLKTTTDGKKSVTKRTPKSVTVSSSTTRKKKE